MKHHFAAPSPLPLPCIVYIRTGENPADAFGGHLLSVSPIEVRMAVLRAVARDVKARDHDKIRAWRRHLLSCHFVYVVLDSADEVWKYARQLREDIAQNFATLRFSALQATYEFVHFRNRFERARGKHSARALAEAYRMGIKFAQGSEEVTDYFVDCALTIDNRMLRVERIAKVLLQAEEVHGTRTPFDSVSKLQAIISKARTEDRIIWAVDHIYDMWQCGRTDSLSLRHLNGGQAGSGGKGFVDLLNYKYELKEYLGTFLSQYLLWPARDQFAKALANHDDYRKHCGFPHNHPIADLTWRAGWPASAENAFEVWEALWDQWTLPQHLPMQWIVTIWAFA
jgi:hypothetical protein